MRLARSRAVSLQTRSSHRDLTDLDSRSDNIPTSPSAPACWLSGLGKQPNNYAAATEPSPAPTHRVFETACPFGADSRPRWNRRLDHWRRAVHPTGGHPVINHRSETVRGARRVYRVRGWCCRVVAAASAGCLLLVGRSASHPASSATTSTSLGESFSISTPEGTVTRSRNGCSSPPGLPIPFPPPPRSCPGWGQGRLPSPSGGHQVAVFQVPGTGLYRPSITTRTPAR